MQYFVKFLLLNLVFSDVTFYIVCYYFVFFFYDITYNNKKKLNNFFNVTLIKNGNTNYKFVIENYKTGLGLIANSNIYIQVRSSPLLRNGYWIGFFISRIRGNKSVLVSVRKTFFPPVSGNCDKWGLETFDFIAFWFSFYSTVPNIYRARY